MIYASNATQVSSDLDAWFAKAQRQAALKLKVTAIRALHWISLHSPQFSGDFAANWKVAVNGIDSSFRAEALGEPEMEVGTFGHLQRSSVRQQGDMGAVKYAVAAGGPIINRAKLGDFITIANSAQHDQAYAWKIENNQIKFRDENPEGGRVIQRFVESFRSLPT